MYEKLSYAGKVTFHLNFMHLVGAMCHKVFLLRNSSSWSARQPFTAFITISFLKKRTFFLNIHILNFGDNLKVPNPAGNGDG
jgi:hypothetical protein